MLFSNVFSVSAAETFEIIGGVTELSGTCTEFAFNIGSGNVIYLKDVDFN